MFRTFFNLDAPETVSTPSIASLLATAGVSTNDGFTADLPPITIEQPAAETAAPAEESVAPTAPSAEAAETPAVVPPTATEEPTAAVPAPIDAPAPDVPTLAQVLLNSRPEDVLKEIGFDDSKVAFISRLKDLDPKMVAFLQHWEENNGDVSAYVKELSTDYKGMPAEDVMRHQLRKEYPKANDRQLELLYNQKVVRAYNLDSDDETEAEEGRLLLEAESEKYRDGFIAEQQTKILPKPPEKTPAAPTVDPALKAAEETFGIYKQKVDASPAVKTLLQNRKIALEDGFSYPLQNADGVVKNLTNVLQTYISVGMMTPENVSQFSEDFIQDQLLIGAISQNPKAFLREYAQHVKSLGAKSVIDTLDNARPADPGAPSVSEPAPASAAAAMARSGVLTR